MSENLRRYLIIVINNAFMLYEDIEIEVQESYWKKLSIEEKESANLFFKELDSETRYFNESEHT